MIPELEVLFSWWVVNVLYTRTSADQPTIILCKLRPVWTRFKFLGCMCCNFRNKFEDLEALIHSGGVLGVVLNSTLFFFFFFFLSFFEGRVVWWALQLFAVCVYMYNSIVWHGFSGSVAEILYRDIAFGHQRVRTAPSPRMHPPTMFKVCHGSCYDTVKISQ